MTKENYKKATTILEQIEKLSALKNRIQRDYDTYKPNPENKHLLETLELCTQVVSVLKEIDENKFKEL